VDLLPLGADNDANFMSATYIQALKPNVTQKEALRTFSGAGLSTLYWKMRSGPLQRIAEVYVPYWLYRVQYNMGRAAHTSLFAIDAVNGSLDLFTFPRAPSAGDLVSIHTRNRIVPSLQRAVAEDALRQKVLRVIFQQGFFKVRDLKLEIAPEPIELHMPYWLGFYGNVTLRCRVLNAVRRRMEGAKASALFESWLAA
jgi:hypothetical protein